MSLCGYLSWLMVYLLVFVSLDAIRLRHDAFAQQPPIMEHTIFLSVSSMVGQYDRIVAMHMQSRIHFTSLNVLRVWRDAIHCAYTSNSISIHRSIQYSSSIQFNFNIQCTIQSSMLNATFNVHRSIHAPLNSTFNVHLQFNSSLNVYSIHAHDLYSSLTSIFKSLQSSIQFNFNLQFTSNSCTFNSICRF